MSKRQVNFKILRSNPSIPSYVGIIIILIYLTLILQTTIREPQSPATPKTRTILVNHRVIELNQQQVQGTPNLPDNRVITSKYTLLNFIPKNIFEQFRRVANFYFLCIGVIQTVTNSPVSPVTSLTPLIFVVVTTAIKQGYEDWLRHKADNAVNRRKINVLVGENFEERESASIRVGDIVQVFDNQEIPCDLVVLSTDSPDGRCHVTTANLDGETNLKVIFAHLFLLEICLIWDFIMI